VFLSNGVAVTAQADAFSDRTPLLADANYYAPGSHIELSGVWAAYSELYRRQVWVNTVIRKLANGTARLPFVVSERTPTGQSDVDVESNPFAQLMNRPGPRLDPFTLWVWTSSTYDVYGEAYWLKLRDNNGVVRELVPLHPTNLVLRRKEDGSMVYVLTSGVRNAELLPEIPEGDVVPFRNYNPENLSRGLSNLEPLRQTLLNEDASRRATASWWARGARPSIMLKHPKRLNDDIVRRLREQAESRHGGADNMGSAMVLEEGMDATVVQLSAEEMQYIESRKLNREEVCAAYDVPPPVVHILDKATFSNITEQMRSMYRDTMGARLPLFESAVDHHLRVDFDPTGKLAARFDLDGVLRGDFETRASAVTGLIGNGVMKPSEARPLFGLPDAGDAADQLFANAALWPLTTPRGAAPPSTTPAGLSYAGKAAPSLPPPGRDPALRALMGSLGRKSPAEHRAVLRDEHRAALRKLFDKQRAAVLGKAAPGLAADDLFSPDDWEEETTATLTPLTHATILALGAKSLAALGGSGRFDFDRVKAWTDLNIGYAAANLNATTLGLIAAALTSDDPKAALTQTMTTDAEARADDYADTRVNSIGNFAETEGAKQATGGQGTKTWVVNSGNPRPTHAAMSGQSVGISDDFSNGMHYPGDPSVGDAKELAGCDCTIDFARGD
jgi:HK97 family phage portal protein